MRSKTSLISATSEVLLEQDGEERQLALEYIAEAWNAAEEEGLDPAALAPAWLFAAITPLVRAHGEDAAAANIARLPERIRAGDYNLSRSLQ